MDTPAHSQDECMDEVQRLRARVAELEQRRRDHQHLEEKLKLISRAMDQTSEGIAVADLNGYLLFLNNALATMHGYDADELISRHISVLHPEPHRDAINAAFKQAIATGEWRGEAVDIRRDGTEFPTVIHASLMHDDEGTPFGVMGTIRDITEQKRFQQDLYAAEEAERRFQGRLKTLIEVRNELALTTSFNQLCRRAIELGRSKLGFDRLAIWSQTDTPGIVTGLYGTDEQGRVRNEQKQRVHLPAETLRLSVLPDKLYHLLEETDLHNHHGKPVGRGAMAYVSIWDASRFMGYLFTDNLIEKKPITAHDGELLALYGSALGHMLSRKKVEQELRFQAMLLDQIGSHVVATDLQGNITYVNETQAEALDRSKEEIIGQRIDVFGQTPDQGPSANDIIHQTLHDGQWHGEIVKPAADGQNTVMDCRTWTVFDDQGNPAGICGVASDMTEKKRLEDQLRQAQKMEAVGQLAGGVAHDFNNLLTVILGNTQIMLGKIRKNQGPLDVEEVNEVLSEVHQAGERAANLTRQLLAFSRKQVRRLEVFDPNRVISEMEGMIRRLIGEHIEVQTDLPARIHRIYADAGQLEQVILNLVVNARDAMPEGGRLTIRTENVTLSEADVAELIGADPGPHVAIHVADTGTGIPQRHLKHVFEPFFTTKPVGRGTGLGLATVYGIVKQADGHITVDSEPGAGTCFHILVPASEEAEPAPDLPETAATSGGHETVLLCEDEEMVRHLAKACLTAAGYDVIEAEHGKHALSVVQSLDRPVHLLITDVIMPEMNGQDLAMTLRDRYPGLRVLMISGYTADIIDRHLSRSQTFAFLQKPFKPSDLLSEVSRLLNARST